MTHMEEGISRKGDKYNDLFFNVVRYAALIVPFLIAPYVLLIELGYVGRSPLYSSWLALLIMVALLAVAIWQFVSNTNSRKLSYFYVPTYHVFSSLLLLFVSGFIAPLTLLWFMLTTITHLFFGVKGAIYSLLLMTSVGLVHFSLGELSLELLILHFLYILVVASAYFFTSRLHTVHAIEHVDLVESKARQDVQQSQLTALVNSINESIISTNARGVIQFYNAATLNLFDTNDSLKGKQLNDVLQTFDANGEPADLFKLLSTSSTSIQRDDLEHRFGDGEPIRLGISSSTVRSNRPSTRDKVEGYILIVRDITKSKSLEEERDEFISVVSHELRTPITITEGTLSNLQLLSERGAEPKTFARALTSAHDQVLYLAKMVNDLSTLSRAERGVADTTELIDIKTLLHNLFTEYEPKARAKGLALNLDTHGALGSVNASPLYLEEVLQNFITNAIKYTQEGSITLAACTVKDRVTISVKDTGIGVSKSDQKRMFEKFYRSEDYRTRETSGTGLGLYIVKKLAHKLGGTIDFTSRLNHGSTFSLTLHTATAPLDEKPATS